MRAISLTTEPPTHRHQHLLLAVALIVVGFCGHACPLRQAEAPAMPAGTGPLLDPPALFARLCSSCHVSGRSGMDFDFPLLLETLHEDRDRWELVAHQLRERKMPPTSVRTPQPTEAERASMIAWVERGLAYSGPAPAYAVRRLQKHEYRNVVRDLLGVQDVPAELPADEPSWQRLAQLPELAPADLELYQAAANAILMQVDLHALMAASIAETADTCAPADDHSAAEMTRRTLIDVTRRAFRRPLEPNEIAWIDTTVNSASAEELAEDILRRALRQVLTSPRFLYRIEHHLQSHAADRQASFELASRLSFLLWSTLPDAELWSLAEQGLLRDTLPAQVRRMLKSPQADALIHRFTHYWLHVDFLPEFGDLDPQVQKDMQKETLEFIAHIIRQDRSVLEIVDADYTFLNERLANHYGIPGIQGEEFRQVSTVGTPRGGILTQGSVLSIMSASDQTSIVQRGKWLLDNILGTPPPPPPPGLLAEFARAKQSLGSASQRDLLEQHRSVSGCAQCHTRIDALGATLENFGPTGAWRTHDGGHRPIDARGVLLSGEVIDGPADLKAYVRGKQDLFVRCLANKLLSYGLGRKLPGREGVTVGESQDLRFSSILVQVVCSEPFCGSPR